MTAKYCIFGFPVEHSLSPAMHNAAFKALGIDATYTRRAVAPDALSAALKSFVRDGFSGANVTVPHKEAVMALLDEVDPAARAIGAVNTIVREGSRLRGCNTDAQGLAESLREASVSLQGARVVVLGAGGAARAAVVGLGQAGATSVVIAARRADRAQALAAELREVATTHVTGTDMSDGLREALSRATLLVQATSATLASDPSDPNAQAFADSVPVDVMPSDATVVDLVYKPRVTTLMQRAQDRGLHTVDGLGMLLHQGAVAFSLWTKQRAPIDVMRAALLSQLSS